MYHWALHKLYQTKKKKKRERRKSSKNAPENVSGLSCITLLTSRSICLAIDDTWRKKNHLYDNWQLILLTQTSTHKHIHKSFLIIYLFFVRKKKIEKEEIEARNVWVAQYSMISIQTKRTAYTTHIHTSCTHTNPFHTLAAVVHCTTCTHTRTNKEKRFWVRFVCSIHCVASVRNRMSCDCMCLRPYETCRYDFMLRHSHNSIRTENLSNSLQLRIRELIELCVRLCVCVWYVIHTDRCINGASAVVVSCTIVFWLDLNVRFGGNSASSTNENPIRHTHTQTQIQIHGIQRRLSNSWIKVMILG